MQGASLWPWLCLLRAPPNLTPHPWEPATALVLPQTAGTTRTPNAELRSPVREAPGHQCKTLEERTRVTAGLIQLGHGAGPVCPLRRVSRGSLPVCEVSHVRLLKAPHPLPGRSFPPPTSQMRKQRLASEMLLWRSQSQQAWVHGCKPVSLAASHPEQGGKRHSPLAQSV